MTRFDFLYELRQGLKDFPEEEIMEHIVFYREMIEDRMEEGISEEDALKEIGTPQEVIAEIFAETPLPKLVKTKLKKERYIKPLHILLIALGFPIWFSLLIAGLSVIFSVIAAIFSVIISFYAAAVSFAACSVTGVILSIAMFIMGNSLSALAALGAGLFLAGGAILLFFGCNALTKLSAKLIKKFILWIKSFFIPKEEEE